MRLTKSNGCAESAFKTVREAVFNFGSYDFLTALNAARKVFCKKVAEIGLRENYCYAEVDVL